ncbi:acyl-CoA thioesterase-1 [Tardiphaga robiniae]|uniref:GDSL-type esterase/lipase family protein n=1 Tax=Tardiphaga robiniae TaxID=943830 RepID=UPI0028553B48|nr:GDSL-type esterase/lipase family protein [Tardiphaga robiniae]MDR6661886.1 acyl-CoA thioesterase-1 [Tardiphaga robiniae]
MPQSVDAICPRWASVDLRVALSLECSYPFKIARELSYPSQFLYLIWGIGMTFSKIACALHIATFFFLALLCPASAQIVAIGGSNTQGRGVSSSESYPAQLQTMLEAKGSRMRVVNAGISGDTTTGMLARLSSEVPNGTKIVILQFGTNDFRRANFDPAVRQANMASIEQQLRVRGIRIVHSDRLVWAALAAGMKQSDGTHLTVEGHRRVAAQLLPSIR